MSRFLIVAGWVWIVGMLAMEAFSCVLIYQREGFWAVYQAISESFDPWNVSCWVQILLFLPGVLLVNRGNKGLERAAQ